MRLDSKRRTVFMTPVTGTPSETGLKDLQERFALDVQAKSQK